jgi:cell division protein FtsA
VMPGMVELGEEVFHMPVRLGLPHYLGGLSEVVRNPRYSTAVGLLLHGLQQKKRRDMVKMTTGSFRQVFERMKSWFKGNF